MIKTIISYYLVSVMFWLSFCLINPEIREEKPKEQLVYVFISLLFSIFWIVALPYMIYTYET